MNRIYFDITDIIEYARSNDQVSGIQRVQVRIITELARTHGGERIICAYIDRRDGQYKQAPADQVFPTHEFKAQELLIKMGEIRHDSLLPEKFEVKRALKPYEKSKALRTAKKLEILAYALMNSPRLLTFGISPKRLRAHITPLASIIACDMQSEDTLVFLGANWNNPKLQVTGEQHKLKGGHVVQLMHDLIPHTAPHFFTPPLVSSFERFLGSTLKLATAYACVSNWTAQDLRRYVADRSEQQPQIVTLPLAHEFGDFPRNASSIEPNSPHVRAISSARPFVLCVGTLEVRKNGCGLLRAWQQLVRDMGEAAPQLLFVGKYGWKFDEFKSMLAEDPQLQRFVTVLHGTSDRDLAHLYAKCLFTVYPSHYEGWGLPVGKSAWLGKFCLASDKTSIPEVCGDLVDYIDPDNTDQLALKLKFLLDHPEYVAQKETRIRQSSLRDWKSVADRLFQFVATELATRVKTAA